MTEPTLEEILTAMEILGGRFVSHLAVLYRYADPDNQRILRTAFADYFREYADLALRKP